MSFGIYEAKRLLRAPLIWYGRRRYASAPTEERFRREQFAYRRAAGELMTIAAIDPHYFYRADLDSASVVVDIGACRGEVAQEIIDLYSCQVYAFEPNPSFYPELEARFVDQPLAHPQPYGLGAADATLVMQQLGLGSTVYGKPDASVDTCDVEIRDVVGVLEELGIDQVDFMKINIEGAEYDLLDRLLNTGRIDSTRYLLIQFHEWYDNAHLRRWKIRRRLRKTHEQIWDYPWIYELWCAKDRPPPPAPKYSEADMAVIVEALEADLAARRATRPQ